MDGNKQNNVIETGVKAYSTYKKIALLASIAGPASFFLIFIVIFIVIIGAATSVLGADNNTVTLGSGKECGFTVSQTSLSKSEFKSLIQEYANTHSQWQIFADNADDYYDYGKANGVNPELVVTVAGKENNGYETTPNTNNYWGWGCPNGAAQCAGLFSFMDGAKNVLDSASKYDTIYNWFYVGHYSWIGDYWLNPGDSGSGGCYYAPYIYPDNMPDRVKNACAKGNECSGSNCEKTVPEEDQAAYSKYLIKTMVSFRKQIFKLEENEGVACRTNSNVSSSELVESYVQWMINISEDNSVGYSQSTRALNPNVDCSSFVYYGLLKGAKFTTNELGSYAFTTYNMADILKKLGFKAYPFKSVNDLERGDILWRTTHTEVYVGDGKNVGAHSNYDGMNGDSSGREVNVQNAGSNWTTYFRYEGDK